MVPLTFCRSSSKSNLVLTASYPIVDEFVPVILFVVRCGAILEIRIRPGPLRQVEGQLDTAAGNSSRVLPSMASEIPSLSLSVAR
jgi:hypothetical protein